GGALSISNVPSDREYVRPSPRRPATRSDLFAKMRTITSAAGLPSGWTSVPVIVLLARGTRGKKFCEGVAVAAPPSLDRGAAFNAIHPTREATMANATATVATIA